MNAPLDMRNPAGAILFPGNAEEPIAAWTLDELDRHTDLDSIRSALAQTDAPDA